MAQADLLVPGLTTPLDNEHFEESRYIYNELPDESEQPPVDEYLNVAELIRRYGLEEYFGIHLAHSHFSIPERNVLLGTDGREPIRRCAKITAIEDIDKSIHGHIFIVTPDGRLHPYEFQEGPPPDFSTFELSAFLRDFVKLVMEQQDLRSRIGLQILDPNDIDRPPMSELSFEGEGNVLVDESAASGFGGCRPTRVTGWAYRAGGNEGLSVLKGNERHCVYPNGTHQPFTDGKPMSLGTFVEWLEKTVTVIGD